MIPNDCRREAGVLKQVNVFGAPYLTDPQTPGLDPPLYPRICSSSINVLQTETVHGNTKLIAIV